jgi:hypothetical protein
MRGAESGTLSPRQRVRSIRDRKNDRLGNHSRASHEKASFQWKLRALAGWLRETGGTGETIQTRWEPNLSTLSSAEVS